MNAGIYQIRHIATGRVYIGSARDFRQRWHAHKSHLRRGLHHSPILQNAWDKYSEGAFVFERLLICDEAMLLEYEQRLISGLQPFFNISPTAGSRAGTTQSPETRRRIATSLKGRVVTDGAKEAVIRARYENAKHRKNKPEGMPRGVSVFEGRYYIARINLNGKSKYLGSFKSAADASVVYEAAVKERMNG